MPSFTKQFLGRDSALGDVVRVVNQMASDLSSIFGQEPVQANSVLLTSVKLTAGTNQVLHTLGRKLTGWQVTRQRSSAAIYDSQDSQPLPSQYLTLVTSADVTVDLLVF
jgi:hypothetical protein